MATNAQSDDFRMRRLLRDSLMARPAPAARGTVPPRTRSTAAEPVEHPALAPAQAAQTTPAPVARSAHSFNLEDEVASSIKKIEQAVGSFGTMRENFTFYKDLVSDLRIKLGEEKTQREELQRDAAAMERLIKSERDRANRAENLAKSSGDVIHDLEQKLASLQSQTARLVKAVTMLMSAETGAPDQNSDGVLRLVS